LLSPAGTEEEGERRKVKERGRERLRRERKREGKCVRVKRRKAGESIRER